MKILFLSHNFYPFIGGIEANSDILSRAFFKAGHDVRVLTWTQDNTENIYPFPIIRNPNLVKLFQEHRWADLVFENNPCLRLAWPNIFFKHASVIALNTWVSRLDGGIGTHGKTGIQDRIKFKWFKRANKVIAVSDAVRRHSFPPAVVIGNPYQSEVFKAIPEVTKSNNFVYLGRLVTNKGVDEAIKAVKMLLLWDKFLEANLATPLLTIIGEGPEENNLKKMVVDFGLQEQVRIIGSLRGEELAKNLNSHKYMLVPSLWEEPFGNVVLEGMACGCLPIVSDGGGLPDAIGKAGISFKRGDTEDMVLTIQNVLSNPALEKKLRAEAQNHLANHFPEKVTQRYLEIIEATASKTDN